MKSLIFEIRKRAPGTNHSEQGLACIARKVDHCRQLADCVKRSRFENKVCVPGIWHYFDCCKVPIKQLPWISQVNNYGMIVDCRKNIPWDQEKVTSWTLSPDWSSWNVSRKRLPFMQEPVEKQPKKKNNNKNWTVAIDTQCTMWLIVLKATQMLPATPTRVNTLR